MQNRALRFFLGVGRYTPNAAVNGDTGWDSISKAMAMRYEPVVPNKSYGSEQTKS